MFTQLLGSYLLSNKLITYPQLLDAMEYQKSVKLKLGILAINTCFMTANQVEEVHERQKKIDKKFGEIAIKLNLELTPQAMQFNQSLLELSEANCITLEFSFDQKIAH